MCSPNQSSEWEQTVPTHGSPGLEEMRTSCSPLKMCIVPKIEQDLWIPASDMIRNQTAEVDPGRIPCSYLSSNETLEADRRWYSTPSNARDESSVFASSDSVVARCYSSTRTDSRKVASLACTWDTAPQSTTEQPQQKSQAVCGQVSYSWSSRMVARQPQNISETHSGDAACDCGEPDNDAELCSRRSDRPPLKRTGICAAPDANCCEYRVDDHCDDRQRLLHLRHAS